jgi:thiamine transport system substrate-binding protein
MDRRTFVKTAGAGTVVALAGCGGNDSGNGNGNGGNGNGNGGNGGNGNGAVTTTEFEPSGTLTVATYSSFTGEGTAGNYLKNEFEAEYPDVTVELTVPSNGVNQFIQRKQQGAGIDADLYVGLNTGELVRAVETLEDPLFMQSRDVLDRADAIKSDLRIDPEGRAVTYDTGFISLVYDEDEVDAPETFDDLLEPEYEDTLITQNAQQSDPGRAFLLWTIKNRGEDDYLDYWEGLVDNGVTILSDWEPAYNAYLDEEAPMVVSFSTDQVFYAGTDADMSRHQIGFIEEQGYANPEAMARFTDTDQAELGRLFMDFTLQAEHQAQVAVKNVQFPAVDDAELDESFSEFAFEPTDPVTYSFDELRGNVGGWIDQWARQIASQ